MSYYTVNYLFATYLQSKSGGEHKIVKVEKVRPGKARFFFDMERQKADALFIDFHNSEFLEFENLRKKTIDLAYK